MEKLKIHSNGQWTLEKTNDESSDRLAHIEQIKDITKKIGQHTQNLKRPEKSEKTKAQINHNIQSLHEDRQALINHHHHKFGTDNLPKDPKTRQSLQRHYGSKQHKELYAKAASTPPPPSAMDEIKTRLKTIRNR